MKTLRLWMLCTVLLVFQISTAMTEIIPRFDAALNLVVADILNNMPLPPDIERASNGELFPIVLGLADTLEPVTILMNLEANGIIIDHEIFEMENPARLYPAKTTIDGLFFLADNPAISAVYSAVPIQSESPLDMSAPEIWANTAWYTYASDYNFLRGTGILIAIADTGVDIYHPSLFRMDAANHTYDWYDNGNGYVDNSGSDWVDLNRDMSFQSNEILRFFDGRTTDWQNIVTNTDGIYQANVDWLYNDSDNDNTRSYGPGTFVETDPGLGEMLFVADDQNSNNLLDPGESIIALNESKIMATYNSDYSTRSRGIDLMQSDTDTTGHGTEVTGVLGGGWPGFSRYTGIAPNAELLMYNRNVIGIGQFYTWAATSMGAHIMLWEIGAWSGQYLDGSDLMDQQVDAAHGMGILQIVTAGNLAGANRHASGMVDPGTPSEYVFPYVPAAPPSYYHLWVTILWPNFDGTPPTFDIYDPVNAGWYMNMPSDSIWHPIGGSPQHQFNAQRSTSSRGTNMFFIEIQSYPSGNPLSISSNFFQINVNSATSNPSFMLHAYVADDATGWSGGVTLGSYGNINVTDANTITSPATADNALAVASYSTRTDGTGSGTSIGAISYFSGRGPRIDSALSLDVAAPGDFDVYSTASISESLTNFIGEFREFGGTSAAAPHVAGAAALYLQFDPATYGSNPATLTSRIQNDAISDVWTGSVPNNTWGYGKLRIAITPVFSPSPSPTPIVSTTPTAVPTAEDTPTPVTSVTATPTPVPFPGDYGDAPDESYSGINVWDAYIGLPGFQPAHFPSCFNTHFGIHPFGVHHLIPSNCFLSFAGIQPSVELDIHDPLDPDTISNLDIVTYKADRDDSFAPGPPDDGVTFQFSPSPSITVFVNGPQAYINMLADITQDGDWNDSNEHVLTDVLVTGGMPVVIALPPSAYGSASGPVWVRVTSTLQSLGTVLPFPWDGSIPIPLMEGESEDYLITIEGVPTTTPTIVPPIPATTTPLCIGLVCIFSVLLFLGVRRPRINANNL
ncbi:S8 family serine peptidase [bacterium]|nr:S8 family serine peptidase [candidate division CSSED10-310 bacterium]